MADGQKRVGVIAILIEDRQPAVPEVNRLLSEFGELIIGRMGVPCREREVNVISLIVEGTNDQLGALTGRLGNLPNVTTRSLLLTR